MKDQSEVENKSLAPSENKGHDWEVAEPDTDVPTDAPDPSLPQEDDK